MAVDWKPSSLVSRYDLVKRAIARFAYQASFRVVSASVAEAFSQEKRPACPTSRTVQCSRHVSRREPELELQDIHRPVGITRHGLGCL